jgi:hypothetical protein
MKRRDEGAGGVGGLGPVALFAVALGGAAIACGDDSSSIDAGDTGAGDLALLESGPDTPPLEAGDTHASDAAPAESAAAAQVASPGDDGGSSQPAVDGGANGSFGTVVVTADATLLTMVTGGPCAAVASVSAAPNEAAVGHVIQLTASGIDSNGESSDVSIAWTASGSAGSLTAGTGTQTTFQCSSPGSETITVTATIGDGGGSCAGSGSLAIMLRCDPP